MMIWLCHIFIKYSYLERYPTPQHSFHSDISDHFSAAAEHEKEKLCKEMTQYVQNLCAEVLKLYKQQHAFMGAPMIAFCVYSCAYFVGFLIRFPTYANSPTSELVTPNILEFLRSILQNAIGTWPIASEWLESVDRESRSCLRDTMSKPAETPPAPTVPGCSVTPSSLNAWEALDASVDNGFLPQTHFKSDAMLRFPSSACFPSPLGENQQEVTSHSPPEGEVFANFAEPLCELQDSSASAIMPQTLSVLSYPYPPSTHPVLDQENYYPQQNQVMEAPMSTADDNKNPSANFPFDPFGSTGQSEPLPIAGNFSQSSPWPTVPDTLLHRTPEINRWASAKLPREANTNSDQESVSSPPDARERGAANTVPASTTSNNSLPISGDRGRKLACNDRVDKTNRLKKKVNCHYCNKELTPKALPHHMSTWACRRKTYLRESGSRNE